MILHIDLDSTSYDCKYRICTALFTIVNVAHMWYYLRL